MFMPTYMLADLRLTVNRVIEDHHLKSLTLFVPPAYSGAACEAIKGAFGSETSVSIVLLTGRHDVSIACAPGSISTLGVLISTGASLKVPLLRSLR